MEDATEDLYSEYKMYCSEWVSKKAANADPLMPADSASYWKAVDAFKYWSSKSSIWPTLSKLAFYWMEFPTSAIAAERAFALARVIDVPQRRGMSWGSFKRELTFRLEQEQLQALMEAKLMKL